MSHCGTVFPPFPDLPDRLSAGLPTSRWRAMAVRRISSGVWVASRFNAAMGRLRPAISFNCKLWALALSTMASIKARSG